MDIDRTGVIERLIEENTMLRAALRDVPKRELQIAAQLDTLMDELTRMGPRVAARILSYVNSKYYKQMASVYEFQLYDRRPAKPRPTIPCPLCAKDDFKSRSGMAGHVWKTHGKKLSDVENAV